MKEDEQKKPTVNHGRFTMVYDWKQSSLGVKHEVGDCHGAAGQEGSWARQQTNCNQKAADQFDPTSRNHQAI